MSLLGKIQRPDLISNDGVTATIVLNQARSGKTPSWKKHKLIPVRKKVRPFFPAYGVLFILETDITNIETYITSKSKDDNFDEEDAGHYISTGMSEWFNYHHNLEPGDKLNITKLENNKRYSLKIEKN